MTELPLRLSGNVARAGFSIISPGFLLEQYGHHKHIAGVARDPIRLLDRLSIRIYMERMRFAMRGRVLDYGAGTQPYRDLVEDAGAKYFPYDIAIGQQWGWEQPFDTVMVNQVLQYVEHPIVTIEELRDVLRPNGHIVLTFATNWDEVPNDCYGFEHANFCDRWRFTAKGMETLFQRAGFAVVDITRRCEVNVGGFTFPIGYGMVGRKVE